MRQPVQKRRDRPSISQLPQCRDNGLPHFCVLIGGGPYESGKRVAPNLTDQGTGRSLAHLGFLRLKRLKKPPSYSRILIQFVQGLRRRQSHRLNRVAEPGNEGHRLLLRQSIGAIQIPQRPSAPLSYPAIVVL